jgi:hypothetical protein
VRISQSFACAAARTLPWRALLAAVALAPLPVAAQPAWGARTSAYQIGGWTDLSFAGATALYTLRLDVDPLASTVGRTNGVLIETLAGAHDIFWTGDDAYVGVRNVRMTAPNLAAADVLLASLAPALDPARYPGSMRFGYVTDVVDAPAVAAGTSWIGRGVVGSRWALTFAGGGVGFLDDGRFDVVVDVAGDWTDPTRHALLGVNSGWTVVAPTFDGRATRFHAFVDDYAGDTDAPGGNPNLVVRLFGDVAPTTAPEPGTLALVVAGIAGLALIRRRPRGA